MSSLIHATITVSGDESQLDACDARIKLLLADQPIEGEVSEHHGAQALCYDLKVKGGIPFPAFVEASQAFPMLKMVAEWVNVDAGARGAATIVNGQLTAHQIDALDAAAHSARPVHVAVAGDGRLELALTFLRSNREEWLGYALTADRDALLRVVRAPESDAVELFATEGGEEWSLRWRGSVERQAFDAGIVDPPQLIDQAAYRELEQMARDFVATWIWFSAGPEEEIAIEKDRFARYGYVTAGANVRSARLHKMRQESERPEGRLEFSTLTADETWVKVAVACSWLKSEKA